VKKFEKHVIEKGSVFRLCKNSYKSVRQTVQLKNGKKIWRRKKQTNVPPTTNDPVIPLLGIYLKECAPGYNGATCTPMFSAALFTITTFWKQPRYPTTDDWIKKMWYIYTMEFYSAIKKN
jgi:hypothetical protein